MSWRTVLLKLTSFKAKDAFKWKAVIKNLEQEAEALEEDRKNPWPEPVFFPMGFLLSAQAENLQNSPRSSTPIMATQPKGVAYKSELSLALLWENHWWTNGAEISAENSVYVEPK